MKAWVVTILSLVAAKRTSSSLRVIALVSGRKDEKFMKRYIETLYFILCADLREQKDSARYTKPYSRMTARSTSYCDVFLASHPYVLRAQLSDIIDVKGGDGDCWLKWKGVKYRKISIERDAYRILDMGEEDPPIEEAPQIDFRLRTLFAST